MRESRDALGDVVAAMRAHPRVAVVGPAGAGRSAAVAAAVDAVGIAWPLVRGFFALRMTPLGAVAAAIGAGAGESAATVVDRFRRRAADGVVVEDAHLLDDASLDLVAALPRWVATCRTDTPAVLDRLVPEVVVVLDPFEVDDARRTVRQVLGPVAERTVDRVVAAAGGRPLLLREVTGRGAPRTTLRARLAAVVADHADDVQADLAVLGCAAHVAERIGMSADAAVVPEALLRGPAVLAEVGFARGWEGGWRADPVVLALHAHDVRPGSADRHRRLAEHVPDPRLAAAHALLAGDDPRPDLRAAGLVDPDADLGSGTDLDTRAALLALAAAAYPDDLELAEAALAACLAAGDLGRAREFAAIVPGGPSRLRAAVDLYRGSPDAADLRRRVAEERGATGWRLEAEADLAIAAVAAHGPTPAAAARLLALLDDPLLDLARPRVAAMLARVLAWLGRDADARRLLRYLEALGAHDPEVEAEVHWLAGRDHRAAALEGTWAGAWARFTSDRPVVGSGDDPERAALAWIARDPGRAAVALQRLADDAADVTTRWRRRYGAVLAWRSAADPRAAEVGDALAEDLRRCDAIALVRRLGNVARPPAEAGPAPGVAADPLTPREREVLVLVGEGMTSREVAAHLGITTATVETHVASAMRRLGATTRLEAVARLVPS